MLRAPLIAVLTFTITGCMAQRITFRPNEAEQRQLAETPLPYAVNVVHWPPRSRRPVAKAYGEALFNLLRKSGSFRALTYDSTRQQPADLTVESTAAHCNSSVIPLWTILSLGIIPTVWQEKDCVGMVFRRNGAAAGSDSVVVTTDYTGTAMMGWLALPVMLAPGWSLGGASEQAAYRQKIRLAILAKRDDLARLAR